MACSIWVLIGLFIGFLLGVVAGWDDKNPRIEELELAIDVALHAYDHSDFYLGGLEKLSAIRDGAKGIR